MRTPRGDAAQADADTPEGLRWVLRALDAPKPLRGLMAIHQASDPPVAWVSVLADLGRQGWARVCAPPQPLPAAASEEQAVEALTRWRAEGTADAPAPETTNQPSDPPPDPDAPAPVTPLPVGVGGDDVLWRALRGENTKP